MGTTPIPPTREPSDAEKLAMRAVELSRIAIAGSPVGSIRRIILYVLSALTILLLATNGEAHPERLIIGGVGLIALLINALSDQLA